MANSEAQFHADFLIDEFINHVPQRAKILDIGCGYGRILRQLKNAGFIKLTGTELSDEMINRAKENCPTAKFINHRDVMLPFGNSQFDAIVLSSVLGCIVESPNQKLLLDEIYRALAAGGIVYISDFYINDNDKNIERYEAFPNTNDRPYGVFDLSNGVYQRHHSIEYINDLFSLFNKVFLRSTIFKTMNGNSSKGFIYIGKKC